jgi:hypothetical protein
MKRRSYLRYGAEVELGIKPAFIWGYGKKGKFVCRVEINSAGLAVYTGKKGTRRLGNMSWASLVKRLDNR